MNIDASLGHPSTLILIQEKEPTRRMVLSKSTLDERCVLQGRYLLLVLAVGCITVKVCKLILLTGVIQTGNI